MKFYARSTGEFVHSELTCPDLEGKQFKLYKYEEISLKEAKRRHLKVCPCVHRRFNAQRKLTVVDAIKLAEKHGQKEKAKTKTKTATKVKARAKRKA